MISLKKDAPALGRMS